MQSWADHQKARLSREHPEWDVWYVPNYPTGQTWCARPKGSPIATINADSPEHLIEMIREQEQDGL